MANPSPWSEVMRDLRGVRLAIYDEALLVPVEAERVPSWPLARQDVLGWLVYHRLLWLDSTDGVYSARSMSQAREVWDREGPCKHVAKFLAAAPAPAPEPAEAAEPEPAGAVHTHQTQLFADL